MTDGSDSMVTADLGQRSTRVEQRAGAQPEEVRRRWEAKPWKRQITLRDLALEGEQRNRAAAARRRRD